MLLVIPLVLLLRLPFPAFLDTLLQAIQILLSFIFCGILNTASRVGQSPKNANISSAVNPAGRTSKTHVFIINQWTDATSVVEVDILRKHFPRQQLHILERMSGPDTGTYLNEADGLGVSDEVQMEEWGKKYGHMLICICDLVVEDADESWT
ncbi:hypothetical protein DFH07DRAFT_769810 [Mycena maculata]|uniref:Uncharacterized protein n=1 Tax=Mycena maculata TaxID=230809 RepID=A0AAD7NLX8_9AGAR|nr:hypothetical protein DFH07DRAFT_769810 [Mycena maculata]